MKLKSIILSMLALSLTCFTPAKARAIGAPGGVGAAVAAQDDHGWDAPPTEFREAQRKGFHDGVEAARRDFTEQRPPELERKREFREPPVPPEARDEYRDAFRHAYEMAYKHLSEDREHHHDNFR